MGLPSDPKVVCARVCPLFNFSIYCIYSFIFAWLLNPLYMLFLGPNCPWPICPGASATSGMRRGSWLLLPCKWRGEPWSWVGVVWGTSFCLCYSWHELLLSWCPCWWRGEHLPLVCYSWHEEKLWASSLMLVERLAGFRETGQSQALREAPHTNHRIVMMMMQWWWFNDDDAVMMIQWWWRWLSYAQYLGSQLFIHPLSIIKSQVGNNVSIKSKPSILPMLLWVEQKLTKNSLPCFIQHLQMSFATAVNSGCNHCQFRLPSNNES